MRVAIRTYRIPIIVTALMVIALAFWAWQTWQSIIERGQERQRQHAIGVFETIEGTIQVLGQNRLRRGQIESVLESIIRDSHVRFVILEEDGRRIFQIGDAPDTLVLPSPEGESYSKDRFILWRKVRMKGDAGVEGARVQPSMVGESNLTLGKSGQVMILGVEAPQDHGRYSRALQSMFLTLITGLLFVTASLVAWIMAIRSRLLTEQLETERAHRAHLEELGLAAAGLAHETKNPLGIIYGISQQIADNPEEPKQSRVMLEHIMDEVDKATARLGNFMTFARQRKVNATSLDTRKVGAKVGEILKPDFDAVGVKLEMSCASLRILADEEMLRQILVNLLLNSLHASSAGGKVTVRMERQGGRAALTVEDQGSGISPELLPNIFKPYVAGNADGHGLGLAIVKRFVEEHGWTIRVDSQLNRGTEVTVSGIGLSEAEETEA